jgi:hypothetical protein
MAAIRIFWGCSNTSLGGMLSLLHTSSVWMLSINVALSHVSLIIPTECFSLSNSFESQHSRWNLLLYKSKCFCRDRHVLPMFRSAHCCE